MSLEQLKTISNPTKLDLLDPEQVKDLQTALSTLGYPVGEIDGLIGPKTKNAWAEFKTDVFQGNPILIGPESVAILEEKTRFTFNASAKSAKKSVPLSKEETVQAIVSECIRQSITLPTQIAYILATTQWETAQTFKPVKEAYWNDENWRRSHLKYFPYYGRGYVQLTWRNNYEKYSTLLNIDLVGNPDLALNHDAALFVLVHGFKTGNFTGRKLSDYINATAADFINARRCINGTDHALDIANLADNFLKKLP